MHTLSPVLITMRFCRLAVTRLDRQRQPSVWMGQASTEPAFTNGSMRKWLRSFLKRFVGKGSRGIQSEFREVDLSCGSRALRCVLWMASAARLTLMAYLPKDKFRWASGYIGLASP